MLFQSLRSDQISRSVVSSSLQPHESQHARPPYPSPAPGVHPDSRPSSQWCHPAISSSVVPFSSCLQSFPVSESFPMSQLFAWGGQSTGVSALASFLPKKSQGWSSEWTGSNLYCIAKWLSYTYIDILKYSFPLWFITGYWIEFLVLYSRTLLFIHPLYTSLHLLNQSSQCFPPPSLSPPLCELQVCSLCQRHPNLKFKMQTFLTGAGPFQKVFHHKIYLNTKSPVRVIILS